MFHFDGRKSEFAKAAEELLGSPSLTELTKPRQDDSFALALYRTDRHDGTQYLAGHAGLREPEAIFGPMTLSDLSQPTMPVPSVKACGFRNREGIGDDADTPKRITKFGDHGILSVSRRGAAQWEKWDDVESTCSLFVSLEKLFRDNSQSLGPLYPELWYEEQESRDQLRAAVSSLGRRPTLVMVAQQLALQLGQRFYTLLERSQVRVGIYLFTGHDWRLVGGTEIPGTLPRFVKRDTNHDGSPRRSYGGFDPCPNPICNENAFEWVRCSQRPVLLRMPVSDTWESRIQACDVGDPIRRKGGLCIVPILDFLDSSVTNGIVVTAAWGSEICLGPAHLFLAIRLSLSLSGYFAPFLPVPGFPWWPDAKLSRGGIESKSLAQTPPEIREIVDDLMPTGAVVKVEPITKGLTDADVYRLIVDDERRIPEVPRILKVGASEVIGDELWRYYRYVHNKIVGGHSRIDIARGYSKTKWRVSRGAASRHEESGTAAIVYTFVGPGEHAIPWSKWGQTAEFDEIRLGIKMLMEQLACWHLRSRLEQRKVQDVVITEEILRKQKKREERESHPEPGFESLVSPAVKQTVDLLKKLKDTRGRERVHTCVVHGDPHCDNVFVLLGAQGELKSVAVIDWGKVKSGCHPLTDISILLADLMFRVLWKRHGNRGSEWGEDQYREWSEEFSPEERKLVFVVQLIRMLGWRHSDAKSTPWFLPEARSAAWDFCINVCS